MEQKFNGTKIIREDQLEDKSLIYTKLLRQTIEVLYWIEST